MGRRGTKPIPQVVQRAKGAYEKNPQRENKREAQAPKGIPIQPDGLDAHAKWFWDYLAEVTDTLGVDSPADQGAWEAACRTWSAWKSAADHCSRHGHTYEVPILDKRGEKVGVRVVRHPLSTVQVQTFPHVRSMLAEFGLTPSSRSTLKVDRNRQPDNPFAILAAEAG